MDVHIKLGEPLWRAVGRRRLTLHWDEGAAVTVGQALARLAADYPAFSAAFAGQGLVQAYPYRVFVDAVLVHRVPESTAAAGPAQANPADPTERDYPTPLRDGQTVFILLPAAGG